jgi:hypothetical protein
MHSTGTRHLQSWQVSAPTLSKGKGGRLALIVMAALLLLLLKGIEPCAAATQNLLEQLHLPISYRLSPLLISSGVGSAAGPMQAGKAYTNWRKGAVTQHTSVSPLLSVPQCGRTLQHTQPADAALASAFALCASC